MCLSGAALLNPGAQEDPLKLPSTRWHCLRNQARQRDGGRGSADNIRANGRHDPHQQAEDMTAPTIKRNAAKKTLDQRAPSRHDNALGCGSSARSKVATPSNGAARESTFNFGGTGLGSLQVCARYPSQPELGFCSALIPFPCD